MADQHKAILALYPNVRAIEQTDNGVFSIRDENENEVTVNWDQVNAWQDPDQYKYDRARAYASIEEQLDMQYWDRVNGTSTWKEHIDAVKAAHPKPTE